jgi:hypothetical protein
MLKIEQKEVRQVSDPRAREKENKERNNLFYSRERDRGRGRGSGLRSLEKENKTRNIRSAGLLAAKNIEKSINFYLTTMYRVDRIANNI